jgi:hypothetical protein
MLFFFEIKVLVTLSGNNVTFNYNDGTFYYQHKQSLYAELCWQYIRMD